MLADESSTAFMAGVLDVIASIWADTGAVEAAFRGDGGVHWGDHDHRLYDRRSPAVRARVRGATW